MPPSTRAPSQTPVTEVRLARVSAVPKAVPFRKVRRWRWQVTTYRPQDPVHPGVFDGRLHLRDDCGYTVTRAGAALAASRHVNTRHEVPQ